MLFLARDANKSSTESPKQKNLGVSKKTQKRLDNEMGGC
jgi:hypothetical protein